MILFIALLGITLIVYVTMGIFFVVGLFFPARTRNPKVPFVSVIIAARNEGKNIRACLEKILNQTYSDFEIIAADDRSEDSTWSILTELSSIHSRLKPVRIEEKGDIVSGKKNALDHAIKMSKGEILLFTDADCSVPPEWIASMVRYFSDNVGLVIGFSAVEGKTFFEKLQRYDFLALMTAACGIANLGFPLASSGQNLAYRRKAFDEVGGFEKIRHRISGDDVLMTQLIRKFTKYKIVFASDPKCFTTTKPEGSVKALVHQRSRWASNAGVMLQLNFPFFVYLTSVYVFNAVLFCGTLIGMFQPVILLMTIYGWITKWIVDLLVLLNGSVTFKNPFSFIIFQSWFFVQTPYLLWIGIRGSLGWFKWR